jgi:hypothetical protein
VKQLIYSIWVRGDKKDLLWQHHFLLLFSFQNYLLIRFLRSRVLCRPCPSPSLLSCEVQLIIYVLVAFLVPREESFLRLFFTVTLIITGIACH